MGRKGYNGTSGFTFAEMLTAMVVFIVVIATVSQIYMGSMTAWHRGCTENLSQQKAAWAIQRMAPDIRQGISISPGTTPFDTSAIAVRLPSTAWDATEQTHLNQIAVNGYGQPYLVLGNYVLFYRGDDNGNLDLSGTKIWRKLVTPGGTVLKSLVIADNVVDNPIDPSTGNPKHLFRYWPDVYRLNSVEITVTVQERSGHHMSTTTMNGEQSLRNK